MTFRWMLTAVLLVCGLMTVQAQIPDQVKEIMKKCSEKMESPSGTEIEMEMRMSMLVMKITMNLTVSEKDGKSLTKGSMKMMGHEAVIEDGFDGQRSWKYKHFKLKESGKQKKERKDSLIITKTSKKPKANSDIDLDIDKEYRKAKLKENGRYYVITFSDPIDKEESPKKMEVQIDRENMVLHQVSFKEGVMKGTLTIKRVRFGVSDGIFVLDTSKYPDAVVVNR